MKLETCHRRTNANWPGMLQGERCMSVPFYPQIPITNNCTGTPEISTWLKKATELLLPGRMENTTACPSGCWHAKPSRNLNAPSKPGNPADQNTNDVSWQTDVTILMLSSPRPTDSFDRGKMLLYNLQATQQAMGLARSPAVVIFDGLRCRQKHGTSEVHQAYMEKILAVRDALDVDANRNWSLLLHNDWLHISEATRRAMLLRRIVGTRLVFVIQEDQRVQSRLDNKTSLPDIYNIYWAMRNQTPPTVKSVHFPQTNAKADTRKLCYPNDRCTPHPSLPLLSSVSFNDQPHLILYSHYMDVVWQTVPRGYRTATEHHANAFSFSEGNWGGWLYAGPGHTFHTRSPGSHSSYGAVTGASYLKESV